MSLTQQDLKSIKGVVKEIVDDSIEKNNAKQMRDLKDFVEFTLDKTEMRMNDRFERIEQKLGGIDREIGDLIETNQAFLDKFDDHEVRIRQVEAKTGVI